MNESIISSNRTRSLSGIDIPEEISTVMVRIPDLVHGYGGKEITVEWGQPGPTRLVRVHNNV
jgi:hypothetical protein